MAIIHLKKAFENVRHQLLLLKLQQHGIGRDSARVVLELSFSANPMNVEILNGSSSNDVELF